MAKQMSYTLFTEKYRPSRVEDMLLPGNYKTFFKELVKDGEVPNLLLYSSTPGTGKTSIAKALCAEIDADYLYINASSDNGIDTIREDVSRFASGKSLNKKKKIVIFDEGEQLSFAAQKAVLAMIEKFQNTCRFILTCNYVNKVIPAARSRFQEFNFDMNSKEIREEMVPKTIKRMKQVLAFEKIEYTDSAVEQVVETLYPDIRKMYGLIQQYSKMNGVIDDNILNFESVDDEFYQLILTKKLTAARQFALDAGYNYDDMYSDLYKNLLPLIEDLGKKAQIILVIADYQYKSAFSNDKEIPFVAMLIEIMGIL
jgi:DNA polymerase III delta prime subunit